MARRETLWSHHPIPFTKKEVRIEWVPMEDLEIDTFGMVFLYLLALMSVLGCAFIIAHYGFGWTPF